MNRKQGKPDILTYSPQLQLELNFPGPLGILIKNKNEKKKRRNKEIERYEMYRVSYIICFKTPISFSYLVVNRNSATTHQHINSKSSWRDINIFRSQCCFISLMLRQALSYCLKINILSACVRLLQATDVIIKDQQSDRRNKVAHQLYKRNTQDRIQSAVCCSLEMIAILGADTHS